MFTNILVPVDGSEGSHKAVEVAADLAGRYGARLTLMHVLRRSGSGVVVPDELEPYVRTEHVQITEHDVFESAGRDIVDREAKFLRDKGQKNATVLVEEGDPAKTVVDYAKANGVDLIVIGSRGRGDFAGLLLGSVSHKVAHLAPCTCVTVR